MDAREISDLLDTVTEPIRIADPNLLTDIPADRYILHLDSMDEFASYGSTTPELEALSGEIAYRVQQRGLEQYHQLVLLRLIQEYPSRVCGKKYPAVLEQLFEKQFQRITAEMRGQRSGFYLFGNDSFCKDMGICRQRLLPCGVQVVEAVSGIPRSWFLKGDVKQCLQLARTIAKLGGFRPLIQPHTDRRQLREFSPAGWLRFYGIAAEFLRLNTRLLGLVASAWWYDPEASIASPHLRYLRDVPASAGAKFFWLGESRENTENAIANSLERYRLYKEGRYRPQSYAIVWPRDGVLRMAPTRA